MFAKAGNFLAVFAAFAIVLISVADARPSSGLVSRQKRVSDQRVAELETLLALARMRGKLVTVPVGFGRVDPARIGRRRRSSGENESAMKKLQLLMEALSRDSGSVSSETEENDEEEDDRDAPLSSYWNDAKYKRGGGGLGSTNRLI